MPRTYKPHPPHPPKPPKREAVRVAILVGPIQEQGEMDMLVLTDTQQATLTIKPLNSKGNPAPVDGVPVWSLSTAACTIEPATDGMTALVKAAALGPCQVSVTVDADMDVDEIRNITGTLDVDVRASEAVSVGIEAGAPVEQT